VIGRWPNFLVVGAARSGTTALYTFLARHPEIFAAQLKEPHFFAFPGARPQFTGPGDDEMINRRAVTDPDAYRQLFAGVGSQTAIGEASVSYLYYADAPRNIRRMLGDARIIAILRDPVERAFSNFQFMRAAAREPLSSFAHALDAEDERIRRGWHHIWHYRNLGYYGRQLSRYYGEFPRECLHVLLYEDFTAHPDRVLRDVFRFLGVREVAVDTAQAINVSGRPRSRALARLLVRSTPLKRVLLAAVPDTVRVRVVTGLRRHLLVRDAIPPDAAERLRHAYRDDVSALQDLIQRDLAHWLAPARRDAARTAAPAPGGAE
jgi:hypothetical protein